MKTDFIKNKIFKAIGIIISIALWIILWQILADAIGYEFLFPSFLSTLKAFTGLIFKTLFWKTVFYSFYRIMLGLLLGILFGCAFALISVYFPIFDQFISMGMAVIKSTPVASIVIVLWVLIGSADLPIIIALMMVAPIIWQNTKDAFGSIDTNLYEISLVFELSAVKRFKYVYMPTVLSYFIPAVLTSVGLAWKSGIAAEIISYTKNSIGKNIKDTKDYFETAEMFAWTLAVILISLALEYSIKFLIRRIRSHGIRA